MQDRLDAQTLGLASFLRERGADVDVAPVGGAFRIVYEDEVRAGREPAEEGSDFDALYNADGSHPSLQGAYLAACVIAGRITQSDPLTFADEPDLGPDVSRRLRGACGRALSDPRWNVATIVRPETNLTGGPDAALFGRAVAMSGDGTRVAVYDLGAGAPVVRAFVHSRSTSTARK